MSLVSRCRAWLRTARDPARIDRDVDREIQDWREELAERYEAEGVSPESARRRALIETGGAIQVKEAIRDVRVGAWLESVLRDVQVALRMLRKHPAFTTVAIVTLALGIGATTSIFTLVDQVLLRSLPVAEPEQLWRIGGRVGCCSAAGYGQNDWRFFPWEAYKRFRANTPAFEELAAFQVGSAMLAVHPHGSPAAVVTANGEFVSGNFFKTFGVSTSLGRLLAVEDDQKGAPPVAVISFRAWQEKFGEQPSVIGSVYHVNGHPFTIVGVAPPQFFGVKIADSGMPDLWLPLVTEPMVVGATSRLEDPRTAWLNLIGRVRHDVDHKTVEAQLQVELHAWLASHLAEMTADERAGRERQTLHLVPGGTGVSLIRVRYEDELRLLLLAAACVLLVACANVANLLLARGIRSRDQIALRAALGASRARLVRMVLMESLALAIAGAAGGIVVAYAGTSLIVRFASGDAASWVPVEAAPSPLVLLVALGVAMATALLSGLAPAWKASHADPMEALRGASRTGGGRRHWAQNALVVGQVAASIILLSIAAMLGRSLYNLEHQDFGFDLSGRHLVKINAMLAGYDQHQILPVLTEIEERLRALPGVHGASAALYAPMSQFSWRHDVRIVGRPYSAAENDLSSAWTRVMPGFFETLGSRIVRGRTITDEDTLTTRPIAVVNEAFANQFFGRENPIGRHFGPASRSRAGVYEIVGVVSNVRYFADFGGPVGPMYFVPQAQTAQFAEPSLQAREVGSHFPYSIVIWAPGNPSDLERQIRKVVADFGVPMYDIHSYSEVVRANYRQENMLASVTWLFGFLGMVLAAVGLYGVTGYLVEQRTNEIGVRVALGAERRGVLMAVLRGALWPVAIGLAIGIPAAISTGHLIVSHLFEVSPLDPQLLFGAALLLVLTTLVAAAIPARRAAQVDAAVALRHE